MDPETTNRLLDLCERGRITHRRLQLERYRLATAEQEAACARSEVHHAERELQRIQEEIRAARFHDVGHLSSYLNAENLAKGDEAKYLPLKEQNANH